MSLDTLIYNGGTSPVEKTLASWGISGMVIRLVDADVDTCDFQITTPFDTAPAFNFQTMCEVWFGRVVNPSSPTGFSGGMRVFLGMVRETPAQAEGNKELLSYHLVGPGWWLENQTYEDVFAVFNGYKTPGDPASGINTKSFFEGHVFLNRANASDLLVSSLAWLSTGEQIQKAVQFAIDHGAPIQLLGNISVVMNPGLVPYGLPAGRTAQISAGITTYVDVPVDEVCDVTDMEVIRKQIRWTPDAVMWFDYTTTPNPTLYCKRRPQLTTVNLNILDGTWKQSNVRPRYDLVKNFVDLKFEFMNQVNGISWLQPLEQTWPNPLGSLENGFGGLSQTIRVPGIQLQVTTVYIQTWPVPGANNTAAQLQTLKHFNKWLNDPTVTSVNILNYSRALPNGPAFILSPGDGQLPNWVPNASNQPNTAVKDTLTYQVQITYQNGHQEQRIIPIEFVACDVNTGSVVRQFTKEVGLPQTEPIPPNLAEELYNSLNPVQYSGQIEREAAECDLSIGLGDVINFADVAAYSAMNAVVREVEYDVDAGRTRIRFGPNRVLTSGEYIALLQVTRNRLVLTDPSVINANNQQAGLGNIVNIGTNTPMALATKGAGFTQFGSVSDKPDGSGGNVFTDPTGLFGATGTPNGPAILIQRGLPGVSGDKVIYIAYADCSDILTADSDGYKMRARWYNICVYNSDGSTTVMKAKLIGSIPQPL